MRSFLDAGLEQHVTKTTHKDGNTIDLFIPRPDDNLTTDWTVTDKLYSLFCGMHSSKEKTQPLKTLRSSRDCRHWDAHVFATDLTEHLLETMQVNASVNDLVAYYEASITEIIDRHCDCPLTTRVYVMRLRMPWYNDAIHEAWRLRRRLENNWRKSR